MLEKLPYVVEPMTLDDIDQVKDPSLLCGEIDAQTTGEIRQRLGLEVIIASPAASMRRAAYLAELGWERLARGDTDNASLLSPIYLQNPQINA